MCVYTYIPIHLQAVHGFKIKLPFFLNPNNTESPAVHSQTGEEVSCVSVTSSTSGRALLVMQYSTRNQEIRAAVTST